MSNKKERIVIIDYNAGNVRSVLFALQRLGIEAQISAEPELIQTADKVIFPGVGEASTTMAYLREKKLDKVIRNLQQPVLGICLGMQLLCTHSEENNTTCLGLIPQNVRLFRPVKREKVPHIGWNRLYNVQGALFDSRQEGEYTYFVHSYFVEKGDYTIASCDYILPFSAGLQKDNFYATQFHPEKSGGLGQQILENFLKL